LLHGALQ